MQLKQLRKESLKKKKRLYGIQTHDLRLWCRCTGSNPVQAWIFFRLSFRNCLSSMLTVRIFLYLVLKLEIVVSRGLQIIAWESCLNKWTKKRKGKNALLWTVICFQCYRTKTPKQRFLEKREKGKVKKTPKKPAEAKRGNHLTPTTSSINYNPWSRRYVGEGGRIPIVNSRRESLTGKGFFNDGDDSDGRVVHESSLCFMNKHCY